MAAILQSEFRLQIVVVLNRDSQMNLRNPKRFREMLSDAEGFDVIEINEN